MHSHGSLGTRLLLSRLSFVLLVSFCTCCCPAGMSPLRNNTPRHVRIQLPPVPALPATWKAQLDLSGSLFQSEAVWIRQVRLSGLSPPAAKVSSDFSVHSLASPFRNPHHLQSAIELLLSLAGASNSTCVCSEWNELLRLNFGCVFCQFRSILGCESKYQRGVPIRGLASEFGILGISIRSFRKFRLFGLDGIW